MPPSTRRALSPRLPRRVSPQEEGADSCTPCEVYRNGATPESEFLCMAEHKTEDKKGEIKKQVVCTPQANGYDARLGEGVQNWGCDHPA